MNINLKPIEMEGLYPVFQILFSTKTYIFIMEF